MTTGPKQSGDNLEYGDSDRFVAWCDEEEIQRVARFWRDRGGAAEQVMTLAAALRKIDWLQIEGNPKYEAERARLREIWPGSPQARSDFFFDRKKYRSLARFLAGLKSSDHGQRERYNAVKPIYDLLLAGGRVDLVIALCEFGEQPQRQGHAKRHSRGLSYRGFAKMKASVRDGKTRYAAADDLLNHAEKLSPDERQKYIGGNGSKTVNRDKEKGRLVKAFNELMCLRSATTSVS